MRSPFGRVHPSAISPTGSGSGATWRSPLAIDVDPAFVEPEPVEHGGGDAGRLAHVPGRGVGGEHLVSPFDEQVGGGLEGGVLGLGRRRRQRPRGHLRPGAEFGDGCRGSDAHRGSLGRPLTEVLGRDPPDWIR